MKKKMFDELNPYEDILHLPHHVSHRRPQMSSANRAAQFAPFAAVVGHETAVKEAARNTDQRKELDEMKKVIINDQLREIEAQLPNGFDVEIVYFKPDVLKAGGKYIAKVGGVKKIDVYTKEVLMADGTKIEIDQIYSVEL